MKMKELIIKMINKMFTPPNFAAHSALQKITKIITRIF